jgi:SAM-dependent methyltransferase
MNASRITETGSLADPSDRIARAHVARVAREHLRAGIVRLFLKQAWTEFMIAARKSVSFRVSRNAEALKAYCAMTPAEFEGINARQRWADWRVIPRSLVGRLPARACRAVDLCSGAGDSTEVLAYYLPPDSEIIGLEYNREFVRAARRRVYLDADGRSAKVAFRCQSVLEIFRGADGDPIPNGSVDLVNSCGALGIHFDAASIERLADEIRRVLRAGGLATVDSGREGVRRERMAQIFVERGFELLGGTKSCFLDRFTHLCFRKTGLPWPSPPR